MPPALDSAWNRHGASAPGLLHLLADGKWTPVVSRPERTVYRVDTEKGRFFAKHFTPVSYLSGFRELVIRRKAFRAQENSELLYNSRVDTPAPLALYSRGRFVPTEFVFVTEWLEGGLLWKEYLFGTLDKERDRDRFNEGLGGMAHLIGTMHRKGCYHGDLVGNLIFAEREGRMIPLVIDTEDLHPKLTEKHRLKNLEEMARSASNLSLVTLRERWEFLKVYGKAAGVDAHKLRELWRQGRSFQQERKRRKVTFRG